MPKVTEQNDKFKRAIIISAALHVILFTALIWSSFDENIEASAEDDGDLFINAATINSDAVAGQYRRMQSQGSSAKRSDEQRKVKGQQAVEELCEKQAAKQERLKQLEKRQLAAQEQEKQAEETAKQAELKQKQAEEAVVEAAVDAKTKTEAGARTAEGATKKAAADTRKKAETEAAKATARVQREAEAAAVVLGKRAGAIEAAVAEARKKAATEAAEKAKAEAGRKATVEKTTAGKKAAAEETVTDKKAIERMAAEKTVADKKAAAGKTAANKKATAAKAATEKTAATETAVETDDIFSELSPSRNAPRTRGGAKRNNASPARGDSTKSDGASGADIDNYAGQVKFAIESKFCDASSYTGKICTLRTKLAPDNTSLDIKPESGDPAFCWAALTVTKFAKIPKPSSRAVYEVLKNAPLDLKP